MNKSYLCRNFFLTDWRHIRRKNTIEISSMYWNVPLWIFLELIYSTTSHELSMLMDKWTKALVNNLFEKATPAFLSKVFSCFTAPFNFQISSLRFKIWYIHVYLFQLKGNKTKRENMHLCNKFLTIFSGMTKRSSVLGDTFLTSLFICWKSLNIRSFAGGTSIAAICKKLEQLSDTLE